MGHYTAAYQAVANHHAQQDVDELAALLAILDGLVKPTCALEIGTAKGGLAWALSRLPSMQHLVMVDLAAPAAFPFADRPYLRYDMVTGSTASPATYQNVVNHLDGDDPQIVIIDAAHDYDSALHDYSTFGGLCTPSGIVALHDSQGYPGREDFGVGRLVAELREQRPVMEIYSRPGGPAGWAIVWADPEGHGLQYNDLHK